MREKTYMKFENNPECLYNNDTRCVYCYKFRDLFPEDAAPADQIFWESCSSELCPVMHPDRFEELRAKFLILTQTRQQYFDETEE